MERLTIEDLLLIAEVALDVPGEQLARIARLDAVLAAVAAADGHAVVADCAAELGIRLVRDRPLPYGNKPVALLSMLELVVRNHGVWLPTSGGGLGLAAAIERLAAGRLTDVAFRAWVRRHVATDRRSA